MCTPSTVAMKVNLGKVFSYLISPAGVQSVARTIREMSG